jgi:hypothetical protein
MRRYPGMILLTLGLAACNLVGGDHGPVLVGDWGGPNMELQASRSQITVHLACLEAVFRGPVRLTATGTFSVDGAVAAPGYTSIDGRPARLSGTVTDGSSVVTFGLQDINGRWAPVPDSFTVMVGQPVSWPEGRSCLQ